MCAALLELNPEMYSGWNYRREAVQDILAAGGDAAVEVCWCGCSVMLVLYQAGGCMYEVAVQCCCKRMSTQHVVNHMLTHGQHHVQ